MTMSSEFLQGDWAAGSKSLGCVVLLLWMSQKVLYFGAGSYRYWFSPLLFLKDYAISVDY